MHNPCTGLSEPGELTERRARGDGEPRAGRDAAAGRGAEPVRTGGPTPRARGGAGADAARRVAGGRGGGDLRRRELAAAGFATDWGGASAKRSAEILACDAARAKMAARRGTVVPGDPAATGAAMLAVVDAEAPPLRVFFGDVGLPMIRQEYAKRLEEWEAWDHVTEMVQGEKGNRGYGVGIPDLDQWSE